ncbi:MAG: rod shape-determining protein MreC [Lachnospiraceae bacterium]|nr:rod shape-determining protein MreC [Lachnospiraceae bacterium]
MSPVVKSKGERFTLPSKYLLLILTFICIILMVLTYGTSIFDVPVNSAVGTVIVPFERGISRAGEWLRNRKDELTSVRSLLEENQRLRDQIDSLTEENLILTQERYELTDMQALLGLSETYYSYNKVGARVIFKDAGNWYSSFIIDKGTDDGLAVDMNVIAGGGLVGRITKIGPNWARVTSIISDGVNVSGQVVSSDLTLMVSGDLKLVDRGLLNFSLLSDPEGLVVKGDKVVTSNISDKYLPGLLIGYIDTVQNDANNLTKSGTISVATDFDHLSVVLVITDLKDYDYE